MSDLDEVDEFLKEFDQKQEQSQDKSSVAFNESELNDLLVQDATKPRAVPEAKVGMEEAVRQMAQMGFDEGTARAALSDGHSVEDAVTLIESQKAAFPSPTKVNSPPYIPPPVPETSVTTTTIEAVKPTSPSMISPRFDQQFNKFTANAGTFFKKLGDNIVKAAETATQQVTSPQLAKESLLPSVDLSHIPVGAEGVLKHLGLISLPRIPDIFKDSRETIQDFRTKLFDVAPLSLSDLVQSYQLECQYRQIRPSSQLVAQIVEADRIKQPLQTLDLTGTAMNIEHVRVLAHCLLLYHPVKKLILRDAGLDNEGLLLLVKALLLVDRLGWLSIASNPGVDAVGLKLMTLYVKKSRSLRFLDVSGVVMNMSAVSALAKVVSSEGCTLRGLHLDKCVLNGALMEEFANEFKSTPIRVLSLQGNKMTAADGQWVAAVIANNSMLNRLDLGGNELGVGGLETILTSTQQSGAHLKELFVSENYLSSASLVVVGQFLRGNTSLEFLDLSGNNFLFSSLDDTVAFKDGLVHNKSLKTLVLESVGFKHETAITLAEGLVETNLQNVSLIKNDAVLNPLKANVLQEVFDFGQKALKVVSGTFNQAVANLQQRRPSDPITSPSSNNELNGKHAELALSALMALVVAARQNRSIVQLNVIPQWDVEEAAKRRAGDPIVIQAVDLLNELDRVCRRNTPMILATSSGAGKGKVQVNDEVSQSIERAQHQLKRLKSSLDNALSPTGSSSAMENLQHYYDACVASRTKLSRFAEDLQNQDETTTNQLLAVCSDLAEAIEHYTKLKRDAATKTSPKPFSLDDE
jgi:hypothetical protein